MCLSVVDEKIRKTRGHGYKVFRRYNEDSVKALIACENVYALGVWHKDISQGSIFGWYPKGFHIEDSKKGAFSWYDRREKHRYEVHKVEYKDVVATGKQDKDIVIVAREMFIHPEKLERK